MDRHHNARYALVVIAREVVDAADRWQAPKGGVGAGGI
jgi:hypothetical protein